MNFKLTPSPRLVFHVKPREQKQLNPSQLESSLAFSSRFRKKTTTKKNKQPTNNKLTSFEFNTRRNTAHVESSTGSGGKCVQDKTRGKHSPAHFNKKKPGPFKPLHHVIKITRSSQAKAKDPDRLDSPFVNTLPSSAGP
ncbi:hypothetical protein ElyMa_004045600 [Elysia marginata]|uniref:Uncharacterized protein n=1 Tax=Elysia marginata TaxID=1093978 RepID=A0AAV4G4K1_9GAST|nr:hypothetical protein ElyMa_004045600 [Elysia marginata]